MTITGRGRGGDSVLSSFRHLRVGLALDVDVGKGIGTGVQSLPHSHHVSGSDCTG